MNEAAGRPDHRTRSARNLFAAGPLDRAAGRRRDPVWIARRIDQPGSYFVPVWRTRLIIGSVDAPALSRAQAATLLAHAAVNVFLGEWRGSAYFALDVSALEESTLAKLAPQAELRDLRQMAGFLPEAQSAILAHARGMILWHQRHRFCGRCGAEALSEEAGYVRVCTNPDCGHRDFPRTDPAIIVLVSAGERCLLGRQPHWPVGRYSTIAGFIEPGESAEDAVMREVLEETEVRVGSVHYHSSQPWPFPASLMLGFNAEAQAQTARVGDGELEATGWFSRSDIRRGLENGTFALPPPLSVAFHLIEDWFDSAADAVLRRLPGAIT